MLYFFVSFRHEAAMQKTLSNLGMMHSDQDVTMLAGSHFHEVEVCVLSNCVNLPAVHNQYWFSAVQFV